MTLPILLLILGFGLLVFGADLLIRGAIGMARGLKISDSIIGFSAVAFGTSIPELTVNTFNSARHLNDAVFGNIIGSNLFNTLLILGVCGLIMPVKISRGTLNYEIPFFLVATVLLFGLINDQILSASENTLGRMDALILLAAFGCVCVYIFKSPQASETTTNTPLRAGWLNVAMFVFGLILLVGGGSLTTDNAVQIAQHFGLSEKLIALTVLSIGTSLPELVTSVVAAVRRNSDIAVGNIIGSNLFNFLFILGISGLIYPARYSPELNRDLLVLTVASMLLWFIGKGNKQQIFGKWGAILFLAGYVIYSVYIICRN